MNLVNGTSNTNENNDLLFVNFNQDCTSLAVGTKTGYRLYTINSSEKLQETYSCGNLTIIILFTLIKANQFIK